MNDPELHPDDVVEIRLVRFPVDVYSKVREHSQDLTREFELIEAAARDDLSSPHHVPARLLSLIAGMGSMYGEASALFETRLSAAVSAGDDYIDEVVFRLPRHAGAAARHLGELFDEADEYCRAGRHLLTLATPPEGKRFRDWYLGEFVRQTAGHPAIPWDRYDGSAP